MADYKGIKGFTIPNVSSDPSDPILGQIWYNSTSGTFKGEVVGVAAWSSGGNINTARAQTTCAPDGTSTAGLLFGGSPGDVAVTESYNGTSWTEVNDLNLGRYEIGAGGTQAAALAFGGWGPGSAQDETETWNGTSWTEVSDLNVASRGLASCGTQGAALAIGGGRTPSETTSATVEQWNGTSWTEVNDLNTARKYFPGAGTVTAGLAMGGSSNPAGPGTQALTESFNGTSWSEVNDMNTARRSNSGFGTQAAALTMGGDTAPTTAVTESWNGTSWTEVADLASARTTSASGGTSADGLIAGGYVAPAVINISEEWLAPAAFKPIYEGQVYYNTTSNALKLTTKSISSGVWASGTAINSGRQGQGSAGVKTAGMIMGSGPVPAGRDQTEVYNGSTWTESGDLNTGRGGRISGWGTITAGVAAGGENGTLANAEEYNGTGWTAVTAMNTGRRNAGSAGTQTAGLIVGNPGADATSEEYNGTGWATGGTLNTGRSSLGGGGTLAASIMSGGEIPGSTTTPNTETYNGTSWTETGNLNTTRNAYGSSISGTTSNLLIFGGAPMASSPYMTETEHFNGTSWTELADLATGARTQGGLGTGVSSVSAGGAISGDSAATVVEEWTAPIANETVTVS